MKMLKMRRKRGNKRTELHHFTVAENMLKILESKSFIHSFCLEQTDFISSKTAKIDKMAFAMVCFADILKNERPRLKRLFKSNAYIVMNKNWAIRNGVAPVLYSANKSLTAEVLTILLESFVKMKSVEEFKQQKKEFIESFENACTAMNLLTGCFRKYQGEYNIKKKSCGDNQVFSNNEVQFYLEREWRHIPLVKNGESYYISCDKYTDEEYVKLEKEKLFEYRLKFDKNDIIGIYVPKKYKNKVVTILSEQYGLKNDEIKMMII